MGDAVGADDPRVADVDRPRVGHVEADPEAEQEQRRYQQPARRPGRMQALATPEPDPQRPAEQVEEQRVDKRHRDADFRTVEEEVGDAEAEQDQQVQVRDPAGAAPIEEPDQEEGAERQEHIGRVELVAEGAGVAAGHLPGHLVPGPGLRDLGGERIDEDQGDLFSAGEIAHLPVPFDNVGAGGEAAVLVALADDLRVAVGNARRPTRRDASRRRRFLRRCHRGRKSQGQQGGGRAERRARHQPRAPVPKCSSTIGATSRRDHCDRSSARCGPQPTKSSGPRLSPRRSAPWLPPPAWLAPPQSTAS